MVGKASVTYVRMSARKVRQVINVIRGKDCPWALAQLVHLNKRAGFHVGKLLRSALANVESRLGHTADQLYISKITADIGPSMKRFRPRAMGRSSRILKRTSHIHVELDLRPGQSPVKRTPVQQSAAARIQAAGRRLKKMAAGAKT
ncbi:MAG: 50S ribosomal protein L22 [Candidatus Omnitrophica bacterium]|nr:50S ribosomal protein L22 [Candidatus Omnitrophota bacterium]